MNITRGIRNNNPFNIVRSDNHWLGKLTSTDTRFEQFINIRYGIRAGCILLRNYIEIHHLTDVASIISRFAPAIENQTDKYISFVEKYLYKHGCYAYDIKPHTRQFYVLVCAILQFESNYICTPQYIEDIYKHFKL